jgi:hypothetical protein
MTTWGSYLTYREAACLSGNRLHRFEHIEEALEGHFPARRLKAPGGFCGRSKSERALISNLIPFA